MWWAVVGFKGQAGVVGLHVISQGQVILNNDKTLPDYIDMTLLCVYYLDRFPVPAYEVL